MLEMGNGKTPTPEESAFCERLAKPWNTAPASPIWQLPRLPLEVFGSIEELQGERSPLNTLAKHLAGR